MILLLNPLQRLLQLQLQCRLLQNLHPQCTRNFFNGYLSRIYISIKICDVFINDDFLCFSSNGSAVVQTRLVFNSSSPVLNETAVLSALQALLNSTLSNLTEPVKVLNYTIEGTFSFLTSIYI